MKRNIEEKAKKEAKKTGKTLKEIVEFKEIPWEPMELCIIGKTPLIVQAKTDETTHEIAGGSSYEFTDIKPVEKPKTREEAFEKAIYRISDEDTGIRSEAFHKCAIGAAYTHCNAVKKEARTAVRVLGIYVEKYHDYITKIYGNIQMLEGTPRNDRGQLVYNIYGLYLKWKALLHVEYKPNMYAPKQIMQLFNIAGQCVGVGIRRLEKGGNNGVFHVVEPKEWKEYLV